MPVIRDASFGAAAGALAVTIAHWTRDTLYPRGAAWAVDATASPGPVRDAALYAAAQLRAVGYDLTTDGVLTKCWLSALVAFLAMAVCVCTGLDAAPHWFRRFKTQGSRGYFTAGEWLQATAVSMFNLCALGWLVIIPNWRLRSVLHSRPLSESDAWVATVQVPKLLLCVVFVDFWFFLTHRLIHYGPLYRAIHKYHHRFTAPTAVACMYSTPLEYLIGNLAAVALGPTLTNCHPTSTYTWLAFTLINTAGEHSGYTFFGAERHDAHHEHFRCNYGPVGIADTIFGTQYVGSNAQKWRNDKQA